VQQLLPGGKNNFGDNIFCFLGIFFQEASSTLETVESTTPLTSLLPSLVFVCPSNCGSELLQI
jgi:hypothetical protein